MKQLSAVAAAHGAIITIITLANVGLIFVIHFAVSIARAVAFTFTKHCGLVRLGASGMVLIHFFYCLAADTGVIVKIIRHVS
jgi:hypothetical protein